MKRLMLFLFCLIFLFSPPVNLADAATTATGCWVTQVGNPAESVEKPVCTTGGGGNFDPNSNCQKPPSYPADLKSAILSEFDITMTGFDNRKKWPPLRNASITSLQP